MNYINQNFWQVVSFVTVYSLIILISSTLTFLSFIFYCRNDIILLLNIFQYYVLTYIRVKKLNGIYILLRTKKYFDKCRSTQNTLQLSSKDYFDEKIARFIINNKIHIQTPRNQGRSFKITKFHIRCIKKALDVSFIKIFCVVHSRVVYGIIFWGSVASQLQMVFLVQKRISLLFRSM